MLGSASAQQEDAKVLLVKAISFSGKSDLIQVSQLLEAQAQRHKIDLLNWDAFPYQPMVSFRIAHWNNEIWLKFYVTEQYLLAERTETNSATHRDSCVEFFLDPQQDGNYYNFEVNGIGTTHLAYGPSIQERKFLDPVLIRDNIKISSTLGNEPFGEKKGESSWEMTMVIPADVLVHDPGIQLTGLRARANFFKCGDDTTTPHYLSWNPVGTERPNFHTPEFFGTLIFE